MGIPKREYYEGAALICLIKGSGGLFVIHEAPFFRTNRGESIYMKYCSNSHSNWAFTFAQSELQKLWEESARRRLLLCLICGGDGYVKLEAEELKSLCSSTPDVQRIGCSRRHGERYTVTGPAGRLSRRIAPSEWGRAMNERESHETH